MGHVTRMETPDNERHPIKTLTYAYKLARVRARERGSIVVSSCAEAIL